MYCDGCGFLGYDGRVCKRTVCLWPFYCTDRNAAGLGIPAVYRGIDPVEGSKAVQNPLAGYLDVFRNRHCQLFFV